MCDARMFVVGSPRGSGFEVRGDDGLEALHETERTHLR